MKVVQDVYTINIYIYIYQLINHQFIVILIAFSGGGSGVSKRVYKCNLCKYSLMYIRLCTVCVYACIQCVLIVIIEYILICLSTA